MVIDSGRENVAYKVQAPQQDKPKGRQLPVTLLSGFLVGIISLLRIGQVLIVRYRGVVKPRS
jgi:hypothetical protein